MSFVPGDVVRLKSGGQPMTVAKVTKTAIKCDWWENKRLRSKAFHPDMLTVTDAAPTINVHFVKSNGDGPVRSK